MGTNEGCIEENMLGSEVTGKFVGERLGIADGNTESSLKGVTVGIIDGTTNGIDDGLREDSVLGRALGEVDGTVVCIIVGATEGDFELEAVRLTDEIADGSLEIADVDTALGSTVVSSGLDEADGNTVGSLDGVSDGQDVNTIDGATD
eukprot:gene47238-biopygen2630